MKECNICAARNCRKCDDLMAGVARGAAYAIGLAKQSCLKYQPLEPFKVSVFERCLVSRPNSMIILLNKFGMKFVESKRPPFFAFDY